MGVAQSTKNAANMRTLSALLGAVKAEGTPIETLAVYKYNESVFVLVGEIHTPVGEFTSHPFVDFMNSVCGGDEEWDVFIEGGIKNRHLYRHGMKEKRRLSFQGDNSLEQARIQGFRQCANIRRHAVDVRSMALNLLVTINQKESVKHIFNMALGEVMIENTERVVKLMRGMRKTQLLPVSAYWLANGLEHELMNMANDYNDIPIGYKSFAIYIDEQQSILVDFYAFVRMLRKDNHNVRIFYGGANHTSSMAYIFESWKNGDPGVEKVFQWRRKDMDIIDQAVYEQRVEMIDEAVDFGEMLRRRSEQK
jgi:hypothetical protein